MPVAWQATHSLVPMSLWGLLVTLTSSILPMGVIVWGARAGRKDINTTPRKRRPVNSTESEHLTSEPDDVHLSGAARDIAARAFTEALAPRVIVLLLPLAKSAWSG
jgi:hypothetical protein